MASILKKLSNINIEGDSQISIQAIEGATKAPGIILNIVEDVVMLAATVRDIKFVYCNRYANRLANTITRKTHHYTAQTVFIYQQYCLFVLFLKKRNRERKKTGRREPILALLAPSYLLLLLLSLSPSFCFCVFIFFLFIGFPK